MCIICVYIYRKRKKNIYIILYIYINKQVESKKSYMHCADMRWERHRKTGSVLQSTYNTAQYSSPTTRNLNNLFLFASCLIKAKAYRCLLLFFSSLPWQQRWQQTLMKQILPQQVEWQMKERQFQRKAWRSASSMRAKRRRSMSSILACWSNLEMQFWRFILSRF